MKGKEALKRMGTVSLRLYNKDAPRTYEMGRLKETNDYKLVKAELDKLDRIKEVIKEVNYIGLYKNGCIKIKQIIEEETK